MEEVAIDVNEAHVVSIFSQHRITEELSGTGQFLPATLPAWILYSQVQQFQRPIESLFTGLRILLFPTENASDFAANVGQLLHNCAASFDLDQ